MPKNKNSNSSPTKKTNLSSLSASLNQTKKDFLHASNTTTAYDGYLRRTQAWYSGQTDIKLFSEGLLDSNPSFGNAPFGEKDLEDALGIKPTRFSPMALALTITQWCIELGRGISTGEGIKSAYKAKWDHGCARFSPPLLLLNPRPQRR
jgi:hypothetical protein